jgi:hypothetical protein
VLSLRQLVEVAAERRNQLAFAGVEATKPSMEPAMAPENKDRRRQAACREDRRRETAQHQRRKQGRRPDGESRRAERDAAQRRQQRDEAADGCLASGGERRDVHDVEVERLPRERSARAQDGAKNPSRRRSYGRRLHRRDGGSDKSAQLMRRVRESSGDTGAPLRS